VGIGTERASSAQRGALHRRWQLARAEGNCRGTVWRPRALPTPLPSRRGPASPWAWEFTGTRFFRRCVYHRSHFWGFEKTWFAIRSQKLGPCIMMYRMMYRNTRRKTIFFWSSRTFFFIQVPPHSAHGGFGAGPRRWGTRRRAQFAKTTSCFGRKRCLGWTHGQVARVGAVARLVPCALPAGRAACGSLLLTPLPPCPCARTRICTSAGGLL